LGRALRCHLAGAAAALLITPTPAAGQGLQGWPDVFDPTLLLTLNLQMTPGDWATVQNDSSLSIEVPATFWADGEPPILVSVRRKSATPLNAGAGYTKVSLRIDINEFVLGQDWNDLKKLSLENGDDNNVLNEGLAWQINRLASSTQGFGYDAAHGNWVRLVINGVDTGVYVSPEMRDKRLLENRLLFVPGQTWLYEVEDVSGNHIQHEGPLQPSPAVDALCYPPFAASPSCPVPDLATHLPQYVDMAGLLTLMATDAFTVNPDATLTKAKNFYFADFANGKRMYFPWDLDASPPGGMSATRSIYGTGRLSQYAELLDVPEFRAQYNQIVNDLICGPWSEASLTALLDAIEPILAGPVDADPNNQLTEPAAVHFDGLRSWVSARVAHVIGELEGFQPCPTVQLELNELMASNVVFLEDPDEPGEFPDWFELYNPAAIPVHVGGVYLTDDPLVPTRYQIPNGITIPALGHLLFYADEDPEQGPMHTTFKLAGVGETLRIYDRDGLTLLDEVVFGPQSPDLAYARFPDGSGPWDFVPTATPGAANAPHNPPPFITATQRDFERPGAADVVGISSQVSDDSAVASVTLHYDGGGGEMLIAMLDDGASGDGLAGDGIYGASIPAFPNDTIVRYWVTASDDLGASSQAPAPAPAVTFTYVVGYDPPPLAVNEFMANNDSVIEDPDEPTAFEDWLELYNAGPDPLPLDGMYLTDNLFFPTKFPLPPGLVVPAGGFLLLWADSEPLQGSTHLGFQLAAAGEEIGLFDTDARGNVPISTLGFGPQGIDAAEGRCPDGFYATQPLSSPTPGAANHGAPSCTGGGRVTFSGVAQGGQIRLGIVGVLVVVTTVAGQSAEDVARALAAAINADPVLAGAGITASALGPEIATVGVLNFLEIADPGISAPSAGPFSPQAQVPALGLPATLLLAGLLLAIGQRTAVRSALSNRGCVCS
jgi:hypothetical protein